MFTKYIVVPSCILFQASTMEIMQIQVRMQQIKCIRKEIRTSGLLRVQSARFFHDRDQLSTVRILRLLQHDDNVIQFQQLHLTESLFISEAASM